MPTVTKKKPTDPPTLDIWALEKLSDHPALREIHVHKYTILARQQTIEASLISGQAAYLAAEHHETVRLSQVGASLDEGPALVTAKANIADLHRTQAALTEALQFVNVQLDAVQSRVRREVYNFFRQECIQPLTDYLRQLELATPAAGDLRAIAAKCRKLCGSDGEGLRHLASLTPQTDWLKRSLSLLEAGAREGD